MTKEEFIDYLIDNSKINFEDKLEKRRNEIEKKINSNLVPLFDKYNDLFSPNPKVDPFNTISTLSQLKELIENISKKENEEFGKRIRNGNGGGAQYLRHYIKKLKNEDKTENNQKDKYEEKIEEIISKFSRKGEEVKSKTMKTMERDNVNKNYIPHEKSKSVKAVQYAELLKNSYNIILHGAPGTGKTYLAKEIAEAIGAIDKRMEMVQFHPSYDYTDFMEGLRPVKDKTGAIGFERKDGAFKEFCKKAYLNDTGYKPESEELEKKQIWNNEVDSPKYVFIIDEINRGEIAKILGECMFSIDPGYRVKKDKQNEIKKINTQYQNLITDPDPFKDGFFCPDNVFIIGTMNDIDRGVESMDLAMRRRFVFVEIKAEDTQEDILKELPDKDREITKKAMNELNENIRKKEGLGEDYCIGASYFLKVNNYDSQDKWKLLWDYHLNGLLKEYLRGREDAENSLNELKRIYKNAVENKGEQVLEDEAVDTNYETKEA